MARIPSCWGSFAVAAKFGQLCAAGLCVWAVSVSGVLAGETWISAGAGGSGDSLYSYGGLTIAPVGALNDAGLRTRIWAKALRFNDSTRRPSSAPVASEIHGVGAEAELGWQFVGPDWRFALYAGGAWRDEAGGGNRFGASLAADASYEFSKRWRLIADAKYTVRFDELWAQLRPEFKFDDGLYVGPVSSVSEGRGYKIFRTGASAGGFSYAVPWMGDIYVSVEAGMEFNVTTRKSGPFGVLHMGFAY